MVLPQLRRAAASRRVSLEGYCPRFAAALRSLLCERIEASLHGVRLPSSRQGISSGLLRDILLARALCSAKLSGMAFADFIHLRTRSAYSLSAGAIKVKELVALAKKNAMPAVAMTDAGNLFGALEFAIAAADAGVQPIVGCELGLRRGEAEHGRLAGKLGPALAPDQILLLVQSERGYRNLLELVSKAFLETPPGEAPQIDLPALEGETEGLLLLSGGPAGPIGRLIGEGQKPAA